VHPVINNDRVDIHILGDLIKDIVVWFDYLIDMQANTSDLIQIVIADKTT